MLIQVTTQKFITTDSSLLGISSPQEINGYLTTSSTPVWTLVLASKEMAESFVHRAIIMWVLHLRKMVCSDISLENIVIKILVDSINLVIDSLSGQRNSSVILLQRLKKSESEIF